MYLNIGRVFMLLNVVMGHLRFLMMALDVLRYRTSDVAGKKGYDYWLWVAVLGLYVYETGKRDCYGRCGVVVCIACT